MKIPSTDMIKPPIVPAANGNQKASFPVPTMNGMKPRIVETTVRKIGIILTFHAFTKARTGFSFGKRRRISLYSFMI